MIKSMTKANILLLIYFNGVLPDNACLILSRYPFFKTETKIQNAIKTLNEEKLIKKIRIPNYPHQSNNQKDAYIITAKGQKELFSFGERIGKKVYKRSQKIEQQLKNQQYDMLNRLTETTLLLERNEHFISRSEVYDSTVHSNPMMNIWQYITLRVALWRHVFWMKKIFLEY